MTIQIGKLVSHYQILERLGQGGMGVVYKAEDTKLKRTVALKFLPQVFSLDEEAKKRFIQEAQAASALQHNNICDIHEIDETKDGHLFISMDFYDGESLKQKIEKGPLKIDDAVDITVQILEGLAKAHEKNIIHRDIKPANVFITNEGIVKILDFGLAKVGDQTQLTKMGSTVGTVAYMSPEQTKGENVDHRTDIWSVGVILYEMITGQQPFKGDYEQAVIYSILNENPLNVQTYRPELSAEFLHILNRSLEKKPEERSQSISEMLIDFQRLKRESKRIFRNSIAEMQIVEKVTKTSTSKIWLWLITGSMGIVIILLVLFWFLDLNGKKIPFNHMQITRLTSHGKAKEAAISPDGKYIVHVMEEAGNESLWLRQVVTNSNIQILPAANVIIGGLAFSKDGNYIYYIMREKNVTINTLYRMPVLGGNPITILKDVDGSVCFSPDGTRFSFLRYEQIKGESTIFLSNADGSDEQSLVKGTFPNNFFTSAPAWSPDENTILCAEFRSDESGYCLVKINSANGNLSRFSPQRWRLIQKVIWINDGAGLLITASIQYFNNQIFYVSYPDGNVTRITNDLNNYHGLNLTKDDEYLITVQSERQSNIWLISEGKKGKTEQISSGKYDGAMGITWTSDGKIIHADQIGNLWIVNKDGSNPIQLSSNNSYDIFPSVSPDGKTIVFTSSPISALELWKMNIDGSNRVKMEDYAGDSQISPDGKWIVYTSARKGEYELRKISIHGGQSDRIIQSAAGADISPDGKKIACFLADKEDSQIWNIAILPFEGGIPEKIFELPKDINEDAPLRWSPDGKAITCIINNKGISNIWQQPLDGNAPQQITDFKEKIIFTFDWAPNGDLVCSRGKIDNDVVLIRNIK